MAKIKYYSIVLDGIDKCGKDTILNYVFNLSNKKYLCNARGLMSLIAYSKLYNRNFEYDFEKERNGPSVHFLLQVDKEDWLVRCKMANEIEIDYESHSQAFEDACNEMLENGIFVRRINTSHLSPYEVAKKIVEYMRTEWDS